jgi:hypothetical protein
MPPKKGKKAKKVVQNAMEDKMGESLLNKMNINVEEEDTNAESTILSQGETPMSDQ